jgi:hypothetical protein
VVQQDEIASVLRVLYEGEFGGFMEVAVDVDDHVAVGGQAAGKLVLQGNLARLVASRFDLFCEVLHGGNLITHREVLRSGCEQRQREGEEEQNSAHFICPSFHLFSLLVVAVAL